MIRDFLRIAISPQDKILAAHQFRRGDNVIFHVIPPHDKSGRNMPLSDIIPDNPLIFCFWLDAAAFSALLLLSGGYARGLH